MRNIDIMLYSLSKSKFRSSFHLNTKMKNYVCDKGLDVIKGHAYDFINNRLRPANPYNDGKQTPMRGHPVFIAQHATATCCRECLFKWHHIQKNKELNENEVEYIVYVIMRWINGEMNNERCNN